MILAGSEAERRNDLDELYPFVKRDIKATLEAMDGLPVTFRLLDPPLHEFVPQNEAERKELAEALDITAEVCDRAGGRAARGQPDDGSPRRAPRHHLSRRSPRCRSGRSSKRPPRSARTAASASPRSWSRSPAPRRSSTPSSSLRQKVHAEVCGKYGVDEGRAPLRHDDRDPACGPDWPTRWPRPAEFFSFGTNDLTQMTFGF